MISNLFENVFVYHKKTAWEYSYLNILRRDLNLQGI